MEELVKIDRFRIAAVLILAAGLAAPLAAEEPAKRPEPAPVGSPTDALLGAWNYEHAKLVTMAEDFPADKYGYKPNPAQRSFGEQLLHVAESCYFIANFVQNKAGDVSLAPDKYDTKDKVVAALKDSIEKANAALRAVGDEGLQKVVVSPWGNYKTRIGDFAYGFVVHAGEHYGQLVGYYRTLNMVPPESRPKK
jgi:uncharacterized damage-inducible protein DinB